MQKELTLTKEEDEQAERTRRSDLENKIRREIIQKVRRPLFASNSVLDSFRTDQWVHLCPIDFLPVEVWNTQFRLLFYAFFVGKSGQFISPTLSCVSYMSVSIDWKRDVSYRFWKWLGMLIERRVEKARRMKSRAFLLAQCFPVCTVVRWEASHSIINVFLNPVEFHEPRDCHHSERMFSACSDLVENMLKLSNFNPCAISKCDWSFKGPDTPCWPGLMLWDLTKHSLRAPFEANWCYRSLVMAGKIVQTEDPFYGSLEHGPTEDPLWFYCCEDPPWAPL